jgi:hypothetical protein
MAHNIVLYSKSLSTSYQRTLPVPAQEVIQVAARRVQLVAYSLMYRS